MKAMDTPTTNTSAHTRKSELEKFKLFYEFATPTKEVRIRLRRAQKQ